MLIQINLRFWLHQKTAKFILFSEFQKHTPLDQKVDIVAKTNFSFRHFRQNHVEGAALTNIYGFSNMLIQFYFVFNI